MKDLIILGMGPSRSDCPFDCEVWGVNNGYRQVKELNGRLDKLFIAHRGQEYDWENDPIFDWNELNSLTGNGIEIVSLFKVKELKKITRFPFAKIVKKFGSEYFSDTIAYMLVYALHNNTKKDRKTGLLKLKEPMRIRFYGVDMHTRDEYATERGGIEYFIGVGRTLGALIWIHPDSTLCKTDTGKPYGFYKLNKKIIDPDNIMELQKTPEGVRKLLKKGVLDANQAGEMIKFLTKSS